jgi:hypothetical protein
VTTGCRRTSRQRFTETVRQAISAFVVAVESLLRLDDSEAADALLGTVEAAPRACFGIAPRAV